MPLIKKRTCSSCSYTKICSCSVIYNSILWM
ncbi:hypothetical protein [Caudoviricetes sp.]|nr:hypothetical protein [Caudoviricetes sp.]